MNGFSEEPGSGAGRGGCKGPSRFTRVGFCQVNTVGEYSFAPFHIGASADERWRLNRLGFATPLHFPNQQPEFCFDLCVGMEI